MSVYDDEERRRRWYPIVGGVVIVALLLSILARFGGGGMGGDSIAPTAIEPAQREGARAPLELERAAAPAIDAPAPAPTDVASNPAPIATPATRGDVDGRVVDAATGDPVSDVEVVLTCGAAAETISTNTFGEFRSRTRFPSGELSAVVTDDGPEVARVTIAHDAGRGTHAWLLTAPIGATFPIAAIDGREPEWTRWRARIVMTSVPDGLAGVLAVRERDVELVLPGDSHADRESPWRRLRAGHPPWVRFATVPFEIEPGRALRLELEGDVELRRGRARVAAVRGIQSALQLATDRFARIRGGVSASFRCAGPVRILALPAEIVAKPREGRAAPVWDETYDQGAGFEFDDLTPGAKLLVALAPNARVSTLAYDTDARPSEDPIIRLVEGHGLPEQLWLGLMPASPELASPKQVARLELHEAGPWARMLLVPLRGQMTSVRLPPMPDDGYDVLDIGVDGPPLWETPVSNVPLSSLESPITRPSDAVPHVVVAADALDPSAEPRFDVAFGLAGAMIDNRVGANGKRWLFSPRTPVSFSVWSRGFRPAFGDESSFHDLAHLWTASASLVPGIGAQIWFRVEDPLTSAIRRQDSESVLPWMSDALGAAPLPGVEIEGAGAGKLYSDVEGEARIAVEGPCELRVRAPGWRIDRLVRVEGVGNRAVVWMKRQP